MRKPDRSWKNITNPDPFNLKTNRARHVAGFIEMIRGKINEGWSPFFLTFQFKQLPGMERTVLYQMKAGVEAVYKKLVTRVERNPMKNTDRVPVLVACADRPVPKHSKKAISEVLNQCTGLHEHGIILVPARSRLREDLSLHLVLKQAYYLAGTNLSSIYAEAVNHNVEKAVCHALKAFEEARIDYDDFPVLLPRASSDRVL